MIDLIFEKKTLDSKTTKENQKTIKINLIRVYKKNISKKFILEKITNSVNSVNY